MKSLATNLCIFLTLIYSIQIVVVNASEDTDKKALIKLVNQWIDAEVNSDRVGLSAILHEDFVSTFANGKTINKQQYLDFILSLDIKPFTVNNEITHLHGDTAVVVDVDDSGTTKFTWIAKRHENSWLVIAQTFSRIPKEK